MILATKILLKNQFILNLKVGKRPLKRDLSGLKEMQKF